MKGMSHNLVVMFGVIAWNSCYMETIWWLISLSQNRFIFLKFIFYFGFEKKAEIEYCFIVQHKWIRTAYIHIYLFDCLFSLMEIATSTFAVFTYFHLLTTINNSKVIFMAIWKFGY